MLLWAHVLEQLLAEPTELGAFDFFGRTIMLESGNIMDRESLLALGRELQPEADEESIVHRVNHLYDFYVDLFVEALAQGRLLSEMPRAELEAIVSIANAQSTCKWEYPNTKAVH